MDGGSIFPVSPLMSSVPESNRGHYIALKYRVSLASPLPDLGQFLSLFLLFVTLIVLKNTDQVFCRMPFSVGLPDIFSVSYGLWIWGRNTAGAMCLPFSVGHIRGTGHHNDITIAMLALTSWLGWFLCCKITVFYL